jgi:hypothetical protein
MVGQDLDVLRETGNGRDPVRVCTRADPQVYGGAILPQAGSPARNVKLPEGQANYAGSFMVCIFDNAAQAWDRVKEDIYWKSGVWDKERVVVEELID